MSSPISAPQVMLQMLGSEAGNQFGLLGYDNISLNAEKRVKYASLLRYLSSSFDAVTCRNKPPKYCGKILT